MGWHISPPPQLKQPIANAAAISNIAPFTFPPVTLYMTNTGIGRAGMAGGIETQR